MGILSIFARINTLYRKGNQPMKIGPKTTEKTIQLIADAEKMAKEITSKESVAEKTTAELPRMSLESVMPKQNIVRTAQKAATEKFDVEKAIKGFEDINDTETIDLICTAWKNDLKKMKEQFISGKIPEKEVYKEHRLALNDLNKYETFSNKIFEAIFISPDQNKHAMEIFEKHIEPVIMQSQETMRVIDNLPSVTKAYKEAAETKAYKESAQIISAQAIEPAPPKVITTAVEKQDAATVSTGTAKSEKAAVKTPVEIPAEGGIAAEILESIKMLDSMNGASKIIFQLEKHKSSMPPDKYAELSDMVVRKIQTL